MKVKKLLILSFFVFLLSLCLTLSVSAYNYLSKGLKSIPCDVWFSTSLPANGRDRCEDAMETWNDTCFAYDVLLYAGLYNTNTYPLQDDTNTITYAQTDEGYLGEMNATKKQYTFLWLNWYLVEFDINMNPGVTWYLFAPENEFGMDIYANHYDFESAVLHEFGHALGLAHADSEYYYGTRVVMYYSLPAHVLRRVLSEDDRLGIVNLY